MQVIARPIPVRESTGLLPLAEAAALPSDAVLSRLDTASTGLSPAEAARRLDKYGPNAVVSHRTGPLARETGA